MKVEYVDHMGTDLSVVNAARVSFAKMSKFGYKEFDDVASAEEFADTILGAELDIDFIYGDRWNGGFPVLYLEEVDRKLIKYLADHKHWTPFAHTAITLRMQAPVPIRTQCFKHKVGFVENEESRRYITTPPKYYMPEVWRKAAANKKQGSSDEPLDPILRVRLGGSQTITSAVERYYQYADDLYKELIEHGVCPEQARFVLPQGVEVQWIWTGNLYSYANFYLKRTDPHAQQEIRELAEMVGQVIEPLFPVTWRALIRDA